MSNWLLIPGPGGRATTPTATAASDIVDADATTYYLDCSRCTGLLIQQTANASLGGTFQLKETVDGTNFAAIGTAIPVSNWSIYTLEASTRPFARLKIDLTNVTSIDSTHTLSMVIQGQAIGSGLT